MKLSVCIEPLTDVKITEALAFATSALPAGVFYLAGDQAKGEGERATELMGRCLSIRTSRKLPVFFTLEDVQTARVTYLLLWEACERAKHPEVFKSRDERQECRRRLSNAVKACNEALALLKKEPTPFIKQRGFYLVLGVAEHGEAHFDNPRNLPVGVTPDEWRAYKPTVLRVVQRIKLENQGELPKSTALSHCIRATLPQFTWAEE
jgi:hypothetical protein